MSDVGDDIISTSAGRNVFASEMKCVWDMLLFILKPLSLIATANRSGITMMSCHKLPQVYNGGWNMIYLFPYILTLKRPPFGGSSIVTKTDFLVTRHKMALIDVIMAWIPLIFHFTWWQWRQYELHFGHGDSTFTYKSRRYNVYFPGVYRSLSAFCSSNSFARIFHH